MDDLTHHPRLYLERAAAAAQHTPAALRAASVAGFHDVVWALGAASALGVLVALLVRDRESNVVQSGSG